MALWLQQKQDLVEIQQHGTVGEEKEKPTTRRFAFDFSLFFARIAILIPNVNLSLDMCTFKFALVYILILRSCFCSFGLNQMSS
jgi:hypothetical protein